MPLAFVLFVFAFVLLIIASVVPSVRGIHLQPLALALAVLAWMVR